jgi:two-component system NtrC family sensor kinase
VIGYASPHFGVASLPVLVEDNGCGMSPEIQERIFDPFFTTKPVGEGTGLGLSISFRIVQFPGGEMTVSSSDGKGAAFRILAPILDA